ncbi:3329_t:CDS:2 [Acaulospora morrowiae]|uniref:3329_t:CDS:1 n=1 Tax=Acaulospora morrowiae TaxID=94023 RepID=A0A9N9B3X7_9GLOM|nr:3329_t:CDS:2 [Acaulospora morrowiae]
MNTAIANREVQYEHFEKWTTGGDKERYGGLGNSESANNRVIGITYGNFIVNVRNITRLDGANKESVNEG